MGFKFPVSALVRGPRSILNKDSVSRIWVIAGIVVKNSSTPVIVCACLLLSAILQESVVTEPSNPVAV